LHKIQFIDGQQGRRGDLDALKFDVRRPDDPAPFLVFSRDEFSELGGRTCKDGFTPIDNGLLDFGVSEARIDRLVEHVDDRGGRILWGDNAQPADCFIARYKFTDGRNIRQRTPSKDWLQYGYLDR